MKPDTIYLQLYDEDGERLDPMRDEVTWCVDQINDTDVEYLLAHDVNNWRSRTMATITALKNELRKSNQREVSSRAALEPFAAIYADIMSRPESIECRRCGGKGVTGNRGHGMGGSARDNADVGLCISCAGIGKVYRDYNGTTTVPVDLLRKAAEALGGE